MQEESHNNKSGDRLATSSNSPASSGPSSTAGRHLQIILENLEQQAEVSSGEFSQSSRSLFDGRRIGLEKESLRVRQDGEIAQSDHPRALGSALSNSLVTTDFSEALLELVTPALSSAGEAYEFLCQTHKFVSGHMPEDEFIWNTSMPASLNGVEKIRIGNYGSSNSGVMKTVYRRGLGLRYGKVMQTIAGVHYNFSWPAKLWQALARVQTQVDEAAGHELSELASGYLRDSSSGANPDHATKGTASHPYVSESYMATTRNLLRNGWLIPLLFGASPAVCRSFLQGGEPLPGMQVHKQQTLFEPYATSLRMGDIGYNYKRDAAATIQVDYSSLASYTSDLHRLIKTPHPRYVAAGLKNDAGEHHQLNQNVLQIENEYYSSVRPKQLTMPLEPPVHAMRRRGIMYLELRSLDVNLFEPAGMSLDQLHFLEVFMLHSLLSQSPAISDEEMSGLAQNRKSVAHNGRDPQLQLQTRDGKRPIRECAFDLLDELDLIAAFLDRDAANEFAVGNGAAASVKTLYRDAVGLQRKKVEDPARTPSAKMLDIMMQEDISFFDVARKHSLKAQQSFASLEKDPAIWQKLEAAVPDSLRTQQEAEAADEAGFEEFLASYLSQLEHDV